MNNWKLFDVVLKNSNNKFIDEALSEWYISNNIYSESTCICTKPHIIYTYEITNRENGNILYPIGSSCIKKFKNKNLDEQLKVVLTHNKIFKNKGKKYDGETFEYICNKDVQYIKFLKEHSTKKIYNELINYYEYWALKNKKKLIL
jgi:hypothetical protein